MKRQRESTQEEKIRLLLNWSNVCSSVILLVKNYCEILFLIACICTEHGRVDVVFLGGSRRTGTGLI